MALEDIPPADVASSAAKNVFATLSPSSPPISQVSSPLRPPTVDLTFHLEDSRLVLPIPTAHFQSLKLQKAEFVSSLPSGLNRETTQSPPALCLAFIEFLLDQECVSRSALAAVVRAFHTEFLHEENEIHCLVARLTTVPSERQRWLGIYYRAIEASGDVVPGSSAGSSCRPVSALFDHVQRSGFHLMAVFGGQGEASRTCVHELAELYTSYRPMLQRFLGQAATLLYQLSRIPTSWFHYRGRSLDLMTWINDKSTIPDCEDIAQAPISVPVIGVLSLARYMVTCRVLNMNPGDLRALFTATTGHSQGLLVATVMAMCDSWDSFYANSHLAIEALFWLGWECHRGAPSSTSPVTRISDRSAFHTEPAYMLTVRGVTREHLDSILAHLNRTLPAAEQVQIALINSRDQFVVAGPVASLVHVSSYLSTVTSPDKDPSRIPFSRRKPSIHYGFLPISTPFHTRYLDEAARILRRRFSERRIAARELKIPVYHTLTGQDLRQAGGNILHAVLDAIAREICDWPLALSGQYISGTSKAPSHIIVFDRGGLGAMVKKIQEGKGIRIIQGADLDSRDPEIGTMRDLFSPRLLDSSTRLQSWAQQFQPRLGTGSAVLETRITSLLGTPPVIAAGMTPTTVPWDFVSAIMNAGYHAELAGGGYRNSSDMAAAINKLVANIAPGRGVTCNLIYANPRAMCWQIALLRRLSHSQVPIDGLTIGAGVPSLEIASEYIRTIGLRHISFKPSSVATIRQVVDIAKAHPDFPIILQWTGGRGGGHHSFEDFYTPILNTYGLIRQQSNIYLVAGSGFGNRDSIYPYISGQWALSLGYPCMPFDGVLLGSRLMVAREAHTSSAVKDIIVSTPGVPDWEWEKTYDGPAGGVITVQSEMGEPIHKIATRGVRLWADMDRTVFRLPRKDRVSYLEKHHSSIIQRLNADFAKPWFGRNDMGDVVNLDEMTYTEVLARLVELMYVHHQERWIDPTYADFTMDVASRALERLTRGTASQEATLSRSVLLESPSRFLSAFAVACPSAADEVLNPEDVSFFLLRSQMPGQKPVNFIPSLDEDFELFFKKDSLWQAEDIDAVVDQDADRVCILHGPVAAQYSLECDESVKDILDTITQGLIERLQRDVSSEESTPGSGSGLITPDSWSSVSGVKEIAIEDFSLSSTVISEPTEDRTVSMAAGALSTSPSWPAWVRAIFGDKMVFRGRLREKNPFRQFVASYPDTIMRYDFDRSEVCVTVQDPCKATSLMKISCLDGIDIRVDLYPPQVSDPLQLVYRFDPRGVPFGLSEITENRNAQIKSFYSRLWLQESVGSPSSIHDTFHGRNLTLTRELLDDLAAAVGPAFPDPRLVIPISDVLPISTGIIIAWDVITRPLVVGELDGDLLHLVHRSNMFEYCPGANALRVGDSVRCQSQVQAAYVEDAGKVVVVEAQIIRSGEAVMTVTSSFLYRGLFQGGSSFRRLKSRWNLQLESNLDEAILRRRRWFHVHENAGSLVGKCVVFNVETLAEDKEDHFKRLCVTGTACLLAPGCPGREVGVVSFQCDKCAGNPVLQFLERKARPWSNQTNLRTPGWSGLSSVEVQMPVSNQLYAEISTDFNPIHVSTIFASLADLPGTVCHGMCTSGIAVAALEHLTLEGDRSRLRRFTAKFTGMVMPLERLVIQLKHTGMVDGRMRFAVDVVRKEGHERVLEAEAIIDQPATAYLFTGQGSQSKGMGMDLYKSSTVAKAMWDGIDGQLYASYGWSVLDIVKNNPKSVTVHFGGKRGRQIRENYLAITTETVLADGARVQTPVLPGLTPSSTSYTFTDPRGLLYSTQFAQPAILLFEAAAVADLRTKGYVSPNAMYAGHSLGEFGALSALSSSIPMGALAELAFYRGLMMQASVSRGDQGAAYGMVAVNPKRVGRFLDETGLGNLVRAIALASQELLEVVNYNVEGEQYVCSGTVTNLWVLGRLMDYLAQSNGQELGSKGTAEDGLILQLLSEAQDLPHPIQLQRGQATIPLEGIDVPFHSSHLRSTVDRFRQCLLKPGFLEGNVDMETLGRYIPNVMARPFSVDEAYIREAYERTQSPILGKMLRGHEV
ncbi:fatty acid synthase beta subunit [Aspergillus ibericus CBS 121593]|uniref:Fatty acid synthase beta subunit n=1 Tax=Aspergillus ibericus CBS 121593 TaxID=1448316 RepID=A0A395GPL1_9EURO|nr:fatty acid synthase beta subunit [Aspergillus ibericus CBS 121593]RAK97276.1 fatty acid synthase beta subunit [Aspergillus ibericus CBS 121593]